MKIVGILGFKGAGKDTAAQALIDDGYIKYAFADPVKDVLATMFDWPRHMLSGDTKESREWREVVDPWWSEKLGIKDFTPRLAMTTIGTDIIRNHFNNQMWILNVEKRMLNAGHDKVVITDCRFPNEVGLVQKYGGKLVRVKKGPEPYFYQYSSNIAHPDQRIREEAKSMMYGVCCHIHPSEWMWNHIPVDVTIENNSTIADLQAAIRKATQ